MIRIDMEMPKNCYECPFAMHSYATLYGKGTKRIQGNYSCVLTHKAITTTKRNRFCPLKEIVRCENCENSTPWYGDKSRCFLWDEDGIDVFNDGFCSYWVERKNNDQTN